MNAIGTIVRRGVAAIFHPRDYFARNTQRPFVEATAVFMCIAGICMVFQFLSGIWNLDSIRKVNLVYSGIGGNTLSSWSSVMVPFDRLLQPIFWLVVVLFSGGLRYGFFRFLGAGQKALPEIQSIALLAALPVLLLSLVVGLYSDFFPFLPGMDPARGNVWLGLALLGLILAGLWEARIWIAGLRTLFQLNFGRAFLIWLSPLAYFLIWVILLSIFRFINLARA